MSESIQIASKWLKDVNDVNFFPVTHINAVRDENNDPLSTLLDRKQDTITTDNKLDWDLVNHPTMPTVYNATLTIQRNGVLQGTFTANASSNKTINIAVPTTASDVSALPSTTKYGASLDMSLNSSTYVLTIQLKDQDGNNLGEAKTVDLPLESMVTGGSYDNSTKKITLTQQSGGNVEIAMGDIISGLQPAINASNKLSADYISDGTTNKVYTATEKTKLNGIQTGAEVNVQSDWNVVDNTSDAFIKNKPTIGNGTLTIWQNQTSKGTFTANQNTASDITITVPTKTSDLTNDSGFLTQHQDISGKQDTLVSGTNIKTINGNSVLGSGDLTIETSSIYECNFTLTQNQGVSEPVFPDDYTLTCDKTPAQIYEAYDDDKLVQGILPLEIGNGIVVNAIADLNCSLATGTSPNIFYGCSFLLNINIFGDTTEVVILGDTSSSVTQWTISRKPSLPATFGTDGQVLITNGSNETNWTNMPTYNFCGVGFASTSPKCVYVSNDVGFSSQGASDYSDYFILVCGKDTTYSGSYPCTFYYLNGNSTGYVFTNLRKTDGTNISTLTKGVYYARLVDGVLVADKITDIIPSQTNNSGKYLTTNGTSLSWATVDALPDQTGQSGKFLTTDGLQASWSEATNITIRNWTYE